MFLSYFTEEAYDRLFFDINKNADKYNTSDEWLEDYFDRKNDYYDTSKSFDVHEFAPYYIPGKKTDEQKTQEDLANVRFMYDAYMMLPPLQATNKYLWTYMCHAIPEYRSYICDRWLSAARENTIKTRYFVTNSVMSLFDNALSRLWWYGHLTYDESSSNPYALTEILLLNQTICTDVIDTLNRMNIVRMKGVLLAIKDFYDLLDDKEGITDYFRQCKKYLNNYAAVTTLDYLSSDDIRELAFNKLLSLRKRKTSKKTDRQMN